MRRLAVDPGQRRVGLAVSEPESGFARPQRTLKVRGLSEAADGVAEEARLWGAEEIVVGLPLHMDGSDSPSALRARKLAARVHEIAGIRTILWDERLSTRAATHALDQLQVPGRRRRAIVDQVAAALLLQSYLDAKAQEHEPLSSAQPPTQGPLTSTMQIEAAAPPPRVSGRGRRTGRGAGHSKR